MSLSYYRDHSDITITQLPGPRVTITCAAAPLERAATLPVRRRALLVSFFCAIATLPVVIGAVNLVRHATALAALGSNYFIAPACVAVVGCVAIVAYHFTLKDRLCILHLSRQQTTHIEATADLLIIDSLGPCGEIDECLKQRWIVDIVYIDIASPGENDPTPSAERWLQLQLIDGRDIYILPDRALDEYHRIILALKTALDLPIPVIQKSQPL